MVGAAGPYAHLNPAASRFAQFAKPDSRHPRAEAKPGVAPVVGAPGRGSGKSDGGAGGNGHQAVDPAPGVVESMYQAQLRKERALADQQEIKARQMAGELVDRDEISRWVSDMIVRTRDTFLRIGPELGDRLAVTSDPLECRRLVTDKVMEGLEAMREWGKAGGGSRR